MTAFDFIEDDDLRITLENSIEYIFTLHEKSKTGNESDLYKEETCRVIILYVISAIEAVLLYFYKKRPEKMEYTEYRFVEQLSAKYMHKDKDGLPLIIAVQDKVEKRDHQIGLRDLVVHFQEGNLIKKETADDILELNDVRNTFHFSKPRKRSCDTDRVEEALKLLLYTIENAPKRLKLKS